MLLEINQCTESTELTIFSYYLVVNHKQLQIIIIIKKTKELNKYKASVVGARVRKSIWGVCRSPLLSKIPPSPEQQSEKNLAGIPAFVWEFLIVSEAEPCPDSLHTSESEAVHGGDVSPSWLDQVTVELMTDSTCCQTEVKLNVKNSYKKTLMLGKRL